MRDRTAQVKNLSIAWEALSRIPQSSHYMTRIEDILDTLLVQIKEDLEDQSTSPDDEIPF